ncbi:MAG: hypothetical protein R3Y46_04930 [Opitutales bacterium]
MYAIKRQLRIWKHELLQMWDKIPFMGRVILGAAISVGFSVWFARDYIKPLNTQVKTLSNLAIPANLDIEKDEEIIMNKDKAKNLQPAIKRAEGDLAKRKQELDILSEDAKVEVINALQQLFARCGLRVLAEQSLDASYLQAQNPTKTTSKKTTVKVPESSTSKLIASKDYQYKIAGSFKQIQAFLLLCETLKWRFTLSNLSMKKDSTSLNGLELDFKLSIYFFK